MFMSELKLRPPKGRSAVRLRSAQALRPYGRWRRLQRQDCLCHEKAVPSSAKIASLGMTTWRMGGVEGRNGGIAPKLAGRVHAAREAAHRKTLRAVVFMSELKLRPPKGRSAVRLRSPQVLRPYGKWRRLQRQDCLCHEKADPSSAKIASLGMTT